MERDTIKIRSNEAIARFVLDEIRRIGIQECCICPGARCSPLIDVLDIKQYFFYDERSAAFFALGLIKKLQRPVAVVTTSGTAVGELLPAAMEGYYSGLPVLLVTTDRPRRFRGTGAPQSAEQVDIFGIYTPFSVDIEKEICDLSLWDQKYPAHLNLCFEDPNRQIKNHPNASAENTSFDEFIRRVENPIAIVGELRPEDREMVHNLLIKLNIPTIFESLSGLRENQKLAHLRLYSTNIPFDGVLRIGGIPTTSLWRDLENLQGEVLVCSMSHLPFSGLSWGSVIPFEVVETKKQFSIPKTTQKIDLYDEFPRAEPSLIHKLSKKIPNGSQIYLGNSLPIREWDLAATYEDRHYTIIANRGLNGIDGQFSTFLGSCKEGSNWAILGDLTTLYDLSAPWILRQLSPRGINIVVINNGGGKIFSRFFQNRNMQNIHNLNFENIAKHWSLNYEVWENIPKVIENRKNRLIELIPDEDSTKRFWEKL